MRILIDLTQVPVQKAGVGVYAENLIKSLIVVNRTTNTFFLLMHDDDPEWQIDWPANFLPVRIPGHIFRILPFRTLIEQAFIPWLVIRHNINLIHSLHYSFPLLTLGAKRVVTVHDLTFLLFPEMHSPSKRIYFRMFLWLAAKLADRIIFVSNSSLRDFLSRFAFPKDRSQVIYHGKSALFRAGLDRTCLEQMKARYGIRLPYLVFVGTLEPRKNIPTLIRAFQRIRANGFQHQLVVAGKKGWGYEPIFDAANHLRSENAVVFTGFVEEHEKACLLSGASVFIYPSFYEGFGLPIVEAMACGVPVVTSNSSSMIEVAGDAALFADPNDEEDLQRKIERLLTQDRLREDLARAGIARAAQFDWIDAATQTLAVYESLA